MIQNRELEALQQKIREAEERLKNNGAPGNNLPQNGTPKREGGKNFPFHLEALKKSKQITNGHLLQDPPSHPLDPRGRHDFSVEMDSENPRAKLTKTHDRNESGLVD